ncbi:MAG: CehA/McbA family metallohydrolase, partial [Bryobacteraceae bacterium]
HMNYAGVYANTPQRLMEQAESEDIHVLNNLICNKEQRIPDIAHFTGAPDKVSTPTRILFHSQEYHPPFWGHATFLNLKKHIVIPDYVGYQNTIVDSIYPSNTTPFRVTREQGGLAGYAHGAGPHFAVDLALGNVDFVEANALAGMEPLYKAWNCGYKVVASAGEDAFPNFYRSYILGSNRVYVRSGAKLDYDKWTADFRAGKSFVTSGPLVLLQVNGKEPGDEIRLPAGTHTLKLNVEVKSITPVESIEVMHNGQSLGNVKTVTLDRSGWISVQVKAKYTRDPIRRPYPFAATMPVWITVDGKPARSKADAEFFVNWIDRTLERAMKLSFNNEMERSETRKLYEEARAKMVRRAAEATQ